MMKKLSRTLLCLGILAVLTMSNSAKAWWDGDWSYRKKITVDAGPKGAALAESSGRIPLLIRLHDGNFKFTDAKDDGSDIRFVAGDDKTPLKFHLDTYDGLLGVALIWVDVPTVTAGQATDIYLYYGNPNAQLGGDAKGTYDADTALVYHFGEKDAPPRDETANANNAAAAVKSIDTGIIGRGIHLDGASPIALPTSPSLTFPAGGPLTWSAWVKFDAVQNGDAVLFAKRDGAGALVVGLAQGAPYVAVTAAGHRNAAWLGARTFDGDCLALCRRHPRRTMSRCMSTASRRRRSQGYYPALAGTSTIGADPGAVADPAAATPAPTSSATAGFVGDLDEMEISHVARGAGFIAASFGSQGPESAMITYGADEENAGLSGGYFGVILRSVTIDGWVVIAILGVMMAVSVTVMVNKAILTNQIGACHAGHSWICSRATAPIRKCCASSSAAYSGQESRPCARPIVSTSRVRKSWRAAPAASRTGYLLLSSAGDRYDARQSRPCVGQGSRADEFADRAADDRHLGRPVSRPAWHRGRRHDHLRRHCRLGRRQRVNAIARRASRRPLSPPSPASRSRSRHCLATTI